MKNVEIDTIDKFVNQAHNHLPSLAYIECVEVSNFFLTFRLRDSTIKAKDLIKLAKCSKMGIEIKAGSRIGLQFSIGLCVKSWDSSVDKEILAKKLHNFGYTVLVRA